MKKNHFRFRDPFVVKHQQKIVNPQKRRKLPASLKNLSCELELLSASLAIVLLTALPELIGWIKELLSSNYGIEISPYGTPALYGMLLSAFIFFVVLRSLFLLVNKKNTPPSGRWIAGNLFLDFFCEILFYASAILLFVCIVGYFIQISGVLLQHFVSLKMGTMPGMSG